MTKDIRIAGAILILMSASVQRRRRLIHPQQRRSSDLKTHLTDVVVGELVKESAQWPLVAAEVAEKVSEEVQPTGNPFLLDRHWDKLGH